MYEEVNHILPSSEEAVLRPDEPVSFPDIFSLLQNAPSLRENCPAVPLVMEDL